MAGTKASWQRAHAERRTTTRTRPVRACDMPASPSSQCATRITPHSPMARSPAAQHHPRSKYLHASARPGPPSLPDRPGPWGPPDGPASCSLSPNSTAAPPRQLPTTSTRPSAAKVYHKGQSVAVQDQPAAAPAPSRRSATAMSSTSMPRWGTGKGITVRAVPAGRALETMERATCTETPMTRATMAPRAAVTHAPSPEARRRTMAPWPARRRPPEQRPPGRRQWRCPGGTEEFWARWTQSRWRPGPRAGPGPRGARRSAGSRACQCPPRTRAVRPG
mmetsp:Transcript_19321/g.64780  ORF Transcript_19321/g.64780 Transcript_19321/m.64780 type:complete len:277 (-) Transcript_19321:193-1023(-)